MEENDRVNLQRVLLIVKKFRQAVAYISSEQSSLTRRLLQHIDEIEKEIRRALAS